jgi:hypothetical protein
VNAKRIAGTTRTTIRDAHQRWRTLAVRRAHATPSFVAGFHSATPAAKSSAPFESPLPNVDSYGKSRRHLVKPYPSSATPTQIRELGIWLRWMRRLRRLKRMQSPHLTLIRRRNYGTAEPRHHAVLVVNQNQTFAQETAGGYLWSPKRSKNGARNPFYEFMREVAPGDLVLSFEGERRDNVCPRE